MTATPSVRRGPGLLGVLAWCVHTGTALAPRGVAGVVLLAPAIGRQARPLELPTAVRVTLSAGWQAMRCALDETHAALGRLALPGWPDVPPMLLTIATWANVGHAALDADQRETFEERAAVHEYEGGCPRWLAEMRAIEDLSRGGAGASCERDAAADTGVLQRISINPAPLARVAT